MDMRINNVIYFHRFDVAMFERFQFLLRPVDVNLLSGSGQQDANVYIAIRQPYIVAQFRKLDANTIRNELKSVGAWDDSELQDIELNQKRIVWIAACNISEEKFMETSQEF